MHGTQKDSSYSDSQFAIFNEKENYQKELVKENLVSRFCWIEVQVRDLKGLIERDTYCDEVITQISYIQTELQNISTRLLENHMKNCVIEKINKGEMEVLDQILITTKKLMKK